MKRPKQYYIKERLNPQLGVYYVACGQMTKKDAKKAESPLYGHAVMHSYDLEAEYKNRLAQLKDEGHSVQ